jgi:L-ascorbate metabolism protein UlaG (beta-lactamase superfamily)
MIFWSLRFHPQGGPVMNRMAALVLLPMLAASGAPSCARGQGPFASDTLPTSAGELSLTFIGHGTLMFSIGGKVIHIDPVGQYADYTTLPKADLILVTHEHGDHLDPAAIDKIRKEGTVIVATAACSGRLPGAVVMKNGERRTEVGVPIEAVPAYNIKHERSAGNPYHPKGSGNGYVLTFGDIRVYVAGDTEDIPEMKELKDITVAFLPMNLPYTMTPEMTAAAARLFHPRILYPYHYGNTDPQLLVELLKDSGIEVRIRDLK